jgi:hypothetical protein
VSGSFAYVSAYVSNSLVVVDISNPASPVIQGSVVSSSLLNGVGMALSCVHLARDRLIEPSRALTRSPSLLCALTGSWRRRERLVRLRGGLCV